MAIIFSHGEDASRFGLTETITSLKILPQITIFCVPRYKKTK